MGRQVTRKRWNVNGFLKQQMYILFYFYEVDKTSIPYIINQYSKLCTCNSLYQISLYCCKPTYFLAKQLFIYIYLEIY